MEQKKYKVVQVGVGGFGAYWVSHFLPPTLTDGRIEMVGIADVNPDALEKARRGLRLAEGGVVSRAPTRCSMLSEPISAWWSCRPRTTKPWSQKQSRAG